ncbi:helix-turn-helix domain-containing protein [Thiococcus pfennigii]|uniref:helix-turn-helix domain-containing protein n=1 Tax=Thiococcus pfennigii TaxID=1057 RepID=UPI00190427A8|nr:helix-turn-helix transcriptional regulator [Thiococcus pfennigii]MBK1732776.1 hypothetical protein [Thiococcus pfennigii]
MSEVNTARLRLARERKGLNQRDISRRLKIADGLAGQWERGSKEPSLAKLKALAKLLEVRVGWLLEDDVEPDLPRTAESRGDYSRRGLDSPQAVLSDYQAPAGLRDLASAADLVKALAIEPHEWSALASLEFDNGLTRDGYVLLLGVLRATSIETHRRELARRPGRPVRPAER